MADYDLSPFLSTDTMTGWEGNPLDYTTWKRPLARPQTFMQTPTLPGLEGSGSEKPGNPMANTQLALALAMLGKAFAKPRYDARGNKVSTFGERLSEPMIQMAQAQMMAKALAAGGTTGTFNPWMYMPLFQGLGGGK